MLKREVKQSFGRLKGKGEFKKYLALYLILVVIMCTFTAFSTNILAATNDPVVKLLFEGSTLDSSGRSNNATQYGSPTYITGISGQAIKFSGIAGQYATFGTPSDLNLGTSNFTVSFWINSAGVTGDPVIISNKNWSNGNNTGWAIALNQSQGNEIEWNFKGATGSRADMDSGLSIADGQWHHIVVSHNRAGNADFYEDGVYKSSVNISASTGSIDTGLPTVIGQDGTKSYSRNLTASVDELQIFKHTLTASEVSSIYSAGRSGSKIIISYSPVNLTTQVGVPPILPSTVDITYDDGSVGIGNVIWNSIDQSQYDSIKSFTVKGVIAGTTVPIKANVDVIEGSGPLFSFEVISDIHIRSSNTADLYTSNLKKALKDINLVDPNSSAINFVGDITESGSDANYDVLNQILSSIPHPNTNMVVGNHDVRYQDYTVAMNRFLSKTGMPSAYYDKWINGYHFIYLATEQALKDNADLSATQLSWLQTKLGEQASSDKPIFVFLHQQLSNTVAGSTGTTYVNQDAQVKAILSSYPQAIFISGHSHYKLTNAFTMYNQQFCTLVNDGAVAFLQDDTSTISQGLFIDVYPNKVLIKGRDFITKEWIPTAQFILPYSTAFNFTPIADSYVRSGSYADTNYGTETSLVVKSDASSYGRKSYVRFDYSTFNGSNTPSAKIRFFVSSVNTDQSRTIKIYGTSDESWSESGITWNNAPSGSTLLGSIAISNTTNTWYQLDVTSYINSHMSDKNVSFVLVNEGTASSKGDVTFNSREASYNKPELIIR